MIDPFRAECAEPQPSVRTEQSNRPGTHLKILVSEVLLGQVYYLTYCK